jgi:hypothetical protein
MKALKCLRSQIETIHRIPSLFRILRGALYATVFCWFGTAILCGQIVYVSDNRSVEVNAQAAIQEVLTVENGVPVGPIVASTNYSAIQTPSTAFSSLSGSLQADITTSYYSPGPPVVSGTAWAGGSATQNSSLSSSEVFCTGTGSGYGCNAFGGNNTLYAGDGGGISILNVSFSVSSPVPYTLVVAVYNDLYDATFSCDLTSSGTSVLGGSSPYISEGAFPTPFWQYGVTGPAYQYSGELEPGTVYTLNASLNCITGDPLGGLVNDMGVDLAIVPEPSSVALCAIGAFLFKLRKPICRNGLSMRLDATTARRCFGLPKA